MRNLRALACLIAGTSLWVTLAASVAAQTAAMNKMPPVIDRELFFGDPEISGAQISPDGKYIAFLKPWNKTRNIWVKRTSEPFDAPGPSPPTPGGPSGLLLEPRREVHPVRAGQGGDENLQRATRSIPPSACRGADVPPRAT